MKVYAVDFDGTLATYDGWKGASHIGTPIETMCDRVRDWLFNEDKVVIFTSRVADKGLDAMVSKKAIDKFCREQFGKVLEVTAVKSKAFSEIWDDRAIAVETNTGKVLGGQTETT